MISEMPFRGGIAVSPNFRTDPKGLSVCLCVHARACACMYMCSSATTPVRGPIVSRLLYRICFCSCPPTVCSLQSSQTDLLRQAGSGPSSVPFHLTSLLVVSKTYQHLLLWDLGVCCSLGLESSSCTRPHGSLLLFVQVSAPLLREAFLGHRMGMFSPSPPVPIALSTQRIPSLLPAHLSALGCEFCEPGCRLSLTAR